jgi:ABC-type multidrug transport system fused ATPase/permease subunit
LGDFVVLITFWAQMEGPMASLTSEVEKMTERLVSAEKLVALLEKSPSIQNPPDAPALCCLEGAVEFENVSFSYDGKRQVAEGITLRAAPRKTIALVGQTGSGKSTILKLLYRFYDVGQGRILIDGQDIRHVKMESFRKHIAIVPQSPAVFIMTIFENLRYPDMDCSEEEVIAACKAVELHDRIITFTKGYQEKGWRTRNETLRGRASTTGNRSCHLEKGGYSAAR